MVLNAFRRHRLGHRQRRPHARRTAAVLNAFRRHRLGHRPRPRSCATGQVVCSTPFGVTDLVTASWPCCSARWDCAQRLSASQTWSRPVRGAADRRQWCSTPFGVTDLVTSSSSSKPGSSQVCSTPFGVTDLVTGHLSPEQALLNSAQRLSASQTWSRDLGRRRPAPACAQRLSASQTWSHEARRTPRHHGTVLNAFRRHRLGHATACALPRDPGKCSTPFGVTDLVTAGRRAVPAAHGRCSTPFGVTDLVTCGSASGVADSPSAQRLSASQTWSRSRRAVRMTAVRCAQRLSASQTWSRRPMVPPARIVSCAQRLSASQTWSLAASSRRRRHRRACSTPFGVTDLVTG